MPHGDQFGRGLRSERAALPVDMRLVLIPEMLERAGDRSDLRVAEGADRAACDVAAQAEQEVRSSCLPRPCSMRSEEHTSELQSRPHLVCRLLLEKKKKHIENISAV